MAGAIAGIGKALPIISGALPVAGKIIGGISRGIGGLLGGKHQERANRVADFFQGVSQKAPEYTQRGQDMLQSGADMYNAGRNMWNGASDAFRRGDFQGGFNQISDGYSQMRQFGQNIYNQGRDWGQDIGQNFGGRGMMPMRPAVMPRRPIGNFRRAVAF